MSESLKDIILDQIDSGYIFVPWTTNLTFEDVICLSYEKSELSKLYYTNVRIEQMFSKVRETYYTVIFIDTALPNLNLMILLVIISRGITGNICVADKNTNIEYCIDKVVLEEWYNQLIHHRLTNSPIGKIIRSWNYDIKHSNEYYDEFKKSYIGGVNTKSARKV